MGRLGVGRRETVDVPFAAEEVVDGYGDGAFRGWYGTEELAKITRAD